MHNRTWFSEAFDPEHRAEKAREVRRAKVARLKVKWGDCKNINTAVIQLRWREGLSHQEISEVLGIDERDIDFEIDMARQRAR